MRETTLQGLGVALAIFGAAPGCDNAPVTVGYVLRELASTQDTRSLIGRIRADFRLPAINRDGFEDGTTYPALGPPVAESFTNGTLSIAPKYAGLSVADADVSHPVKADGAFSVRDRRSVA